MSGWVVLGLIAAVAGYLVFAYNGMVAMRRRADQAFADIDVQLKQRQDLIPNLVETVKGYAAHEKETFDAVIRARNGAAAATTEQGKAQAEQQLTGAVGRLMALAEAYPDLKANTNFLKLQEDLGGVEDKLAAARRFFNNAVGEYNTQIESVPSVFFASRFGFLKRDFFDVGEEKRVAMDVAPQVKF
jgi:LemA protein